ncbi:unnamed protein product [Oreochromis niloticus]|nr:unnamed protein product [Mustela putorius furo]
MENVLQAKEAHINTRVASLQSAEGHPENHQDDSTTFEQEMASLLVLLHLLPPPGGQRSPKISASDASQRLLVFHKSCCSLEEHLCNQQGRQPNLLAVRHQKSKTGTFYITMDEHLIPCQAATHSGHLMNFSKHILCLICPKII